MRNLFIILFSFILFSCQKEVSLSKADPTIEVDDFMKGNYLMTKREPTTELMTASKRVTNPKTDSDSDGIPDKNDKCPFEPETFNGFNDSDGCPDTAPSTSTPAGVILLDFDGQYVAGTSWNANGPLTLAYSGYTSTEIDTVYNRFVRAYAKYNVIVTTNESVYLAAPVAARTRVIFTESWEWYGKVGGVSYVGSFFWGNDTPCFVFSSLLGYNPKTGSDAGIHEAGHTLSLRHQAEWVNGVMTSEYYYGDGVNAPWMGAAYNVPFGSWWKGFNSLGTYQDDDAILTSKLGLK